MNRMLVALVTTMCCAVFVSAEKQFQELKQRDLIGMHLTKLEERFGKQTGSQKIDSNGLIRGNVMKWKVDDGYLEIEVSMGAGIVNNITYVMNDENEKQQKRLKVKNVDLAKGEMTIMPYENLNMEEESPLNKDLLKLTERYGKGIKPQINKDLLKLTERYGKEITSQKVASNALNKSEVIKWKVGDGYLEIETTLGAGIVKDITYVMNNDKGKPVKKLKVKNVNLTTGEMTIELPDNTNKKEKNLSDGKQPVEILNDVDVGLSPDQ